MSHAMLATAGACALSACGPRVAELAKDSPIRQRSGATHSVSVDVIRLTDSNAGYQRALRGALQTCDLPTNTNASVIEFTRTLAAYSGRFYAFKCPEPGKDTQ
ncbi:hypothetical protein [Tateyamaria sp. syn59]|uniref:hypothetical protein n=1 Tax=Tateyamaria sp. syn59 TaxID=2576942 RepID=UPI001CB902CF|nr:hypothetical protein [Tateyamaria sp. syn59]